MVFAELDVWRVEDESVPGWIEDDWPFIQRQSDRVGLPEAATLPPRKRRTLLWMGDLYAGVMVLPGNLGTKSFVQ
jgi:hypothetical protein